MGYDRSLRKTVFEREIVTSDARINSRTRPIRQACPKLHGHIGNAKDGTRVTRSNLADYCLTNILSILPTMLCIVERDRFLTASMNPLVQASVIQKMRLWSMFKTYRS